MLSSVIRQQMEIREREMGSPLREGSQGFVLMQLVAVEYAFK